MRRVAVLAGAVLAAVTQVAAPGVAASSDLLEGGRRGTVDGADAVGDQGKSPATFRVVATEGGPGEGTFQLTLLTPFPFQLPTEHVLDGRINAH
jgi:hypothetical protein